MLAHDPWAQVGADVWLHSGADGHWEEYVIECTVDHHRTDSERVTRSPRCAMQNIAHQIPFFLAGGTQRGSGDSDSEVYPSRRLPSGGLG